MYVKRAAAGKPAAEGTAGKAAKAEPKATPDPRDAWKKVFEERRVETGLSSLSHTQVVTGLKEGEEVALEDPTKPKKKEEGR